MSALTSKIESELSPITKELGCVIVRVAIFTHEDGKTLQIMLEKEDGNPATIGDCEKVSRAISIELDVLNPITGHYTLEVSSTGIDRPLSKPEDFMRFCEKPVVVKTFVLKNDKKIFKGTLESASENGIKLLLDTPLSDGGNSIEFTYDEISSAHIDGFKL